MSDRHSFRVRKGCVRLLALIAVSAALSPAVRAQDAHDEDHGHGYLHFSHPLITESPSPDTKLRFDAGFLRNDDAGETRVTSLVGEAEYAFSRSLSFALQVPFVRLSSSGVASSSAVGNVELSLKGASYAFDESGTLFGGGVSVGLPTGSDAKGIGSGHIYELAPFVDAAVRRGNVEIVGFLTYSTSVNQDAGEQAERSLTLDGSVLWRVAPAIELLAEISTSRALDGSKTTDTFLAPGVKWRPAAWPKIALGVAALRGIGDASGVTGVQLSGFYHF